MRYFLLLALSTTAFASGFNCTEKGGKFSVYLKNRMDPASRTPYLLRLRHDGDLILERRDKQISKHNRPNVVTYTVHGNQQLGYAHAVLQIRFKEGREVLRPGESADAQLIFYTYSTGDREVRTMDCVRWLTNEKD